MKTYSTSGFRSVKAESIKDAAEIFALRMARKAYGMGAYARTCNMTSWAEDMSCGEFSAFIGYSTGQHETTGSNVNFTVHADFTVQPRLKAEKGKLVAAGKVLMRLYESKWSDELPELAKARAAIAKSEGSTL